MLKRIKFKNSFVLLIGILLIVSGVFIGFLDFFKERKEKTFSQMNILLYDNETPLEIDEGSDIPKDENDNKEEETPTEQPSQDNGNNNGNKNSFKYDFIGTLEIPKINLKSGFLDINSRYNNVDYNITVINGSTFPDEFNGNLILAAHSGECSYCYFNRLYKLGVGDIAYLTYKNIKYNYKIVNIYEVPKKGSVPIYRDTDKNTLTLITCTRNSDTKQTIYILERY